MWQMNMDMMSSGVRQVFEQRYAPRANLDRLLDIYEQAAAAPKVPRGNA